MSENLTSSILQAFMPKQAKQEDNQSQPKKSALTCISNNSSSIQPAEGNCKALQKQQDSSPQDAGATLILKQFAPKAELDFGTAFNSTEQVITKYCRNYPATRSFQRLT